MGTVTFLFTDIEGSTRLLRRLGPELYAEALAGHRRVLRDAFAAEGGVEVDTQGDAFFVAFPTATGAVAAAAHGQRALASGPIAVRMGLHTGTPTVAAEGKIHHKNYHEIKKEKRRVLKILRKYNKKKVSLTNTKMFY